MSNKDAYRAPEKSKAETNLTNNITEPVKTNKYLETMKVFDESPKTKAELTEHVESARDMATMTGLYFKKTSHKISQ